MTTNEDHVLYRMKTSLNKRRNFKTNSKIKLTVESPNEATRSRVKEMEGGVVLGLEVESMPVYDTDIEDVIEEDEEFVRKGGFGGEEDNIKDIVVVANDLCSSMIQTKC
ncbi:hypothetical protein Tco_0736180 [Tanacetum coccineum]